MIRCAVDAREFTQPNRLTGVGRFLMNIVVPLGMRPAEFEFHLFTRSPDAVPERLHNLPGVKLETLPPGSPAYQEQVLLPRRAREIGADCFFSPWHKGPVRPGMPMVITVHDIAFLRMPGGLTPWRRLTARWRLRNLIRRSRKVIAVSKFTERDLADMFPQAAEKTVVMYSDIGAEWHRMLRSREAMATASSQSAHYGKYFLYVGTFKPHKNVDLLVKGFAAAVSDGRIPRHNLLLIGGDDENLGRITRLISRLGMEQRVVILRDVDDYSLSQLYQGADWFVTASQYEGYGYPPVEAMIAGCPVICNQTTSLIEVVGSAALPIMALREEDMAGTLALAASMNPARRQEYIAAGARQCRLFSPGQTAEAFARLIRGLVLSSDSFGGDDVIGRKTSAFLDGP